MSKAMSGVGSANPLAHWPRPLTFVLSGGGSYGAVQIGMIRALVEAGVVPEMIVGTSIGALNGATVAADPELAADRLTKIWESIGRKSVFGFKSRLGATWEMTRRGFTTGGPGLYSPEPLQRLIEANTSVDRIENLPIRTVVVATDVLVGRPKLLERGPLAAALRATTALPGIFPPVEIDSVFYVDGGVSANVPVRQALAAGAKSIVVLDANPASMPGTVPRTPLDAFIQATRIMLRTQQANAVNELATRHPIMHLPQPTPPALSSFDFSHTRELIEAGFNATKTFLGDYADLAHPVQSS